MMQKILRFFHLAKLSELIQEREANLRLVQSIRDGEAKYQQSLSNALLKADDIVRKFVFVKISPEWERQCYRIQIDFAAELVRHGFNDEHGFASKVDCAS